MSVTKAAEHALEFVRRRPKWKRICDMRDGESDELTLKFVELPKREQESWRCRGGEDAWREFAIHPCRVDFGFVDELGGFSRRRLPRYGFPVNVMMVFMVGGRHGRFNFEQ